MPEQVSGSDDSGFGVATVTGSVSAEGADALDVWTAPGAVAVHPVNAAAVNASAVRTEANLCVLDMTPY